MKLTMLKMSTSNSMKIEKQRMSLTMSMFLELKAVFRWKIRSKMMRPIIMSQQPKNYMHAINVKSHTITRAFLKSIFESIRVRSLILAIDATGRIDTFNH